MSRFDAMQHFIRVADLGSFAAAAQQLGVAILPEQLAAADARTGLVCTRPIRDAAMTRRHVAAWHKEKYLTASMRRFITLCRSAAEEVEKQ